MRAAALRDLLGRPIGDIRQFYELVALPHIFVFLILIVAGSLVPEGFSALSQKLCAISFVLIFNITAGSRRRVLTLGLLLGEVAGLALIASSFTLVFRLDLFLSLHLPLAMIGLALLLPRLSLGGALAVSAVALSLAAAQWGLSLALGRPHESWAPAGALFVLAAYSVLVINAAFREASGPLVYSAGDESEEPPEIGASVPAGRGDSDFPVSAALRREVAAECSSRAAWLGLLYAGVSIFVAGDGPMLAVALCSSAVALAAVWLLGQKSASGGTLRSAHSNAAFAAFVLIGLWAAMALSGARFDASELATLVAGLLVLGSMPLPARWALRVASAFVLITVLALLDAPEPILPFAVCALTLAVSLRSGARSRLSSVERAALLGVDRRKPPHDDDAEAGWCMALAADAAAVAIVNGGGEVRVVAECSETIDRVEPASCGILLKRAGDGSVWAGMLPVSELGPEHERNLARWLGFHPRRVFLVSWGDPVRRSAIVPVTFGSMLIGPARVLESLAATVGARERAVHADSAPAAQRALQERDREISEIVHLVNNAAQEIGGMVDALRAASEGQESANQLCAVQAVAQRLAMDVSDYRILRELPHLRGSARSEHVDAGSVALELECYLRARCGESSGVAFRRSIPEGASLKAPSRELLAAALRGVCRFALRDGSGAGLSVSVEENGAEIVFGVSVEPAGGLDVSEPEAPAMAAAATISSLAGGRLLLEEGSVRLALPFTIRKSPRESKGRFALLVDNSAEVTTFYSRVAEALSLEPFTADSVEAADAIVARLGEPRIVITDLKLGAVHGLTLVAALRERFGEELPILVVSGDVAPGVSEKVMAAGATRFLSKPIGRRRLFEEIKDVLAG